MRRKARVDANSREIVDALQRCGWDVFDLSRVGKGCSDLLATRRGALRLVEVKGAHGKLTPDQVKFHARFPVRIVRTIDDAAALD